MEAGTRMNLVRDRFIAGIRTDFIQERLLQLAPNSLDEARQKAKELDAARSARKCMQTSATGIYNLSTSNDQEEIQSCEVAVISTNIELQHIVQRNTEMLEQLSMNQSVSTPVMVANSQPLNILGVIPVNISIAGIKCNHKVMITNDIAHDCLLGIDFLIPHACTIDLKQHRLLIGDWTHYY